MSKHSGGSRHDHYIGFYDGYRELPKRKLQCELYDIGYETGTEARVLEIETDPIDGVSYEYESYIKL